MDALALSPSPMRQAASPHRYGSLVHALATALVALEAHESAFAQSLAGIDFDFPDSAPNVEDRAQLQAAAPLYFSSELERAGLLSTAELIAGLFASGAITQPIGPTAQLLHDFWRGRRERLAAEERNAIFSRVIEAPYFDRLMQAVCRAVVSHADGSDLHEQVMLATQAQNFASFLAQRVDPMAAMAARDIVESINTALLFLRDRMLQSAFGVRDLWRLLSIVGAQNGAPTGLAQQHVERGRNGQAVLLWLADHVADRAIRLDPASPADVGVIVAAQRWLATSTTLPDPGSAPIHAALPGPAPVASFGV